jgi:hypothetical protein
MSAKRGYDPTEVPEKVWDAVNYITREDVARSQACLSRKTACYCAIPHCTELELRSISKPSLSTSSFQAHVE